MKHKQKISNEWKEIFKKNNLKYSLKKSYCLDCGHKSFGIINLYPFHTLVCFECWLKTERVKEIK